ncbi:hypothetical protein [Gracilimonas sp. BCB1]|uniref:hypothetical protein n=1 Tax=Gracilimonas sp. BCB1 TaxID=3152362 RepID=UPI0032D8D695
MSKKKSLGHNPLAYSTRRHASFDFITPSDSKAEDSQGVSKEESTDGSRVNKITASYYLEEPVVESVKLIADKKETSYSAVVNAILKNSIRDLINR